MSAYLVILEILMLCPTDPVKHALAILAELIKLPMEFPFVIRSLAHASVKQMWLEKVVTSAKQGIGTLRVEMVA